jgi:hypothetical protein
VAVLVLTALLFGIGFTTQARSPAASTAPGERLPDLDQELPSELDVRADASDGRTTYQLGFRSAVRNIGAGPLIVSGSRQGTTTSTMRVDQIVERVWGPPRVIRGVGQMEYAVSPDHSHWHYLQFDRYQLQRYELRTPASGQVMVADRKTGFCLGDRYRVATPAFPAAPTAPVYRGRCGLAEPELLYMREGISVGYGDDYSGFLEGQDLPLDGLPDGRYVLVHRVNVNRQLRELSYANNAASVLLDLRRENGQPRLSVLASCPDTDRCDGGPGEPTEASRLEIPVSSAPDA